MSPEDCPICRALNVTAACAHTDSERASHRTRKTKERRKRQKARERQEIRAHRAERGF